MISEITKAQLLVLQVGRLKDAGKVEHQHISMAKRNNVWMALECARMARDILGANGIADDYPIMRHMMNLESVKTYEGTHDIHTLIIGEPTSPALTPSSRSTDWPADERAALASRRRHRDELMSTPPKQRHGKAVRSEH